MDKDFIATTPRKVHCTSCKQSFVTAETARCPLCRAENSLIDGDVADLELARQLHLKSITPGRYSGRHLTIIRSLRSALLLVAITCFGVGAILLFDPALSGLSDDLSWRGVLPGLAALAAGLFTSCLAVWLLKRM
jgi:hypothetical protein